MVATDLRRPGLVFIAVVIVGVADELAQTQLPGRHADLPDLAMDVIGALAAVVVLASARRRVFARLAGR